MTFVDPMRTMGCSIESSGTNWINHGVRTRGYEKDNVPERLTTR